jgi:hypothetical protein
VATWKIIRWDGLNPIDTYSLPGNYSDSEIEALLQKLVCSDLTPHEIIAASLRRGDPRRSNHLDRVGAGVPINYGSNLHYTAERAE